MKKVIKIILSVIVLIIILFLLFLYKETFASFICKITGKSTTQVAEPIFIVETSEKKILSDDNTEIDYYFSIKNYDTNNKKSEVDLKYIIEISPKLDNSLILTLYKDDKIVQLNDQKTDYIMLEQSSNQKHTYRLHVKYDRDRTNATQDIKEKIYINASAIQS